MSQIQQMLNQQMESYNQLKSKYDTLNQEIQTLKSNIQLFSQSKQQFIDYNNNLQDDIEKLKQYIESECAASSSETVSIHNLTPRYNLIYDQWVEYYNQLKAEYDKVSHDIEVWRGYMNKFNMSKLEFIQYNNNLRDDIELLEQEIQRRETSPLCSTKSVGINTSPSLPKVLEGSYKPEPFQATCSTPAGNHNERRNIVIPVIPTKMKVVIPPKESYEEYESKPIPRPIEYESSECITVDERGPNVLEQDESSDDEMLNRPKRNRRRYMK